MPSENWIRQYVDAVYVLSVRSFDDRISHIRGEMARHRIEFDFIFEFDANAIPQDLISEVFAPSDMRIAHQSLVLKHRETWRRCVQQGHQRVLVFEDDAVLAEGFAAGVAAAMAEATQLAPGWTVYLGRGNNRYIGAGPGTTSLVAGGELPAADALIFDLEAARRRLDWLASHRVTRPADWLIREVDAATGVRHHWLRVPLVEQGSMNGLFDSVLDDKRRGRGRWYQGLRFRWHKWWKGLRLTMASRRRTG
jgi:glycosyl transferase, family 25